MIETSRRICMGVFHLHINVLMQAFLSMLSKLEVFLLPAIFRRYMMIFFVVQCRKMAFAIVIRVALLHPGISDGWVVDGVWWL